MKTKRSSYVVIVALSVVAWIVISTLLIVSVNQANGTTPRLADTDVMCVNLAADQDYIVTHGLPMASYKGVRNECNGDYRQYYPLGIVVNASIALIIIGIPTALILRHLRKKYAIIAST